jgi:hypothetical protein
MAETLHNFADTLRDGMKSQADDLASMTRNLRFLTEDIRAGKSDDKAEAIARADDPLPTAALLLRVSRRWREAADTADEFRKQLVAAVGRTERARRIAAGEAEA